MNNQNTGGPAFPTENEHQTSNHTYHFEGMTLRDYFAAKAMQGMLTRPGSITLIDDASFAYKMADAMMKVRSV